MISLAIRFGATDRIGAVQYAFRHAAADGCDWMVLYDYLKDDWIALPSSEFASVMRRSVLCASDIRTITPKGEVS